MSRALTSSSKILVTSHDNHSNNGPDHLRFKISELFEFRQIPWLIAKTTDPSANRFVADLIALQVAIYELDAHLEGNEVIAQQDLVQYWSCIEDRLSVFELTVPPEEYLAEIKVYQQRELDLRSGTTSIANDLTDLYRYKSCDVRLMRRLIYERWPQLRQVLPQQAWLPFDLITEVNDDAEDIYEDLNMYNGNRLLLAMLQHGITEAVFQHRNFVKSCMSKATSQKLPYTCLAMVYAVGFQTLELLDQRKSELSMETLEASQLNTMLLRIQRQD